MAVRIFQGNVYLTFGLLICFVPGCGGATSDAPKVVPVTGTVTLDGKPLTEAVVRFIPADPKANGGTGKTDAEGKYSVTHTLNKGVPAGSYKVVIEQYKSRDGKPLKMEEGIDIEQLKMQNMVQQSLPPKYSDFNKTELKADVTAGKSNVIDFPLKGA